MVNTMYLTIMGLVPALMDPSLVRKTDNRQMLQNSCCSGAS